MNYREVNLDRFPNSDGIEPLKLLSSICLYNIYMYIHTIKIKKIKFIIIK